MSVDLSPASRALAHGEGPRQVMMRRRAVTAGVTAVAGMAAALVAGVPAVALAVIAGYTVIGGGRAGWSHPRWYEPMMSGGLACVAATLCASPWWQVGFLAVAVLEAFRLSWLVCRPEVS